MTGRIVRFILPIFGGNIHLYLVYRFYGSCFSRDIGCLTILRRLFTPPSTPPFFAKLQPLNLMTPDDIARLVQLAHPLQILRMRSAGWVLPFLYGVFKEDRQMVVEESKLLQRLAEALAEHTEAREDLEEARIDFGEDEQARSRKYLQSWVQRRILQDIQDADGQVRYQLSAHAEKVFQWLQSLQTRAFVGTESRFRLLVDSLRDVVEHTDDDRARRLEILKDRKAAIEQEIRALELGVMDRYNNAQVQERLELFTRLCYELVSDFREVEDNFKQIHRSIVEQHTRAEQDRGAIVGFAFEAYDSLRGSNQGRSFYAFWDFLISRSGQEDWQQLTDQLISLLQDREVEFDRSFLTNVKSMLLEQGRNVYEANDRMAEKLSRIITEKEISRHRRLRRQIGGIKELVFSLIDEDEVPCGLVLTEPVPVRMPMERRINLEERKPPPNLRQPVNAEERIADLERFNRLLHGSFVDRKVLWKKVEGVLVHRQTATLKEIVEDAGLEHGLSEVVAYFGFLRDRKRQVQIVGTSTEHIPIDQEGRRFVEVPYLLFSR